MKSHASDQMMLMMQHVYTDACIKCGVEPDIRDLVSIGSRTKEEGVSFLTLTLPQFSSDIELSLEEGFVPASAFRAFKKVGRIPAFLQGITRYLFDQDTGHLRDGVISPYVEAVRQICLTYKKVLIPCAESRNANALREFTQIERDFNVLEVSTEDEKRFRQISHHVWFSLCNSLCVNLAIPRHGPGATADRRTGNQKFDPAVEWYEKLNPYFPPDAYISVGVECEGDLHYKSIAPGQERPVKVTLVPKTLKGPRIIAIEPTCMQYTQQALARELIHALEHDPLFSGHINFKDQSVNQRLARLSSIDRSMATLDLSSASDRVPLDLALSMFDSNSDFRDAVLACRSSEAILPNGVVISPLRKFASMGSALCFPVEAMYFYTICVIALYNETGWPVCSASLEKLASMIYVYGDDIVVPTEYAPAVMDHLHKYRCKVNKRKSFYKGFFRESCGVECYDGDEVTPVYIRSTQPMNRQNARELVSYVATANLFYQKGYWRVSSYMFEVVEKILGHLPYVRRNSPGLGRYSFRGFVEYDRYDTKFKWCRSFQGGKIYLHQERFNRPVVRLYVPGPVYQDDVLEGNGALLKCLLRLERPLDYQGQDELHLERSARHGAVALKRRWVSALY